MVTDKRILTTVNKIMVACANPSNRLNYMGKEAADMIDMCRTHIGRLLRLNKAGLIFTSGATEGNNLAIQGIVGHCLKNEKTPFTIVTSSFEHLSVLDVYKHYATAQYKDKVRVKFVAPYIENKNDANYGVIRPQDVAKAIQDSDNVKLVSIMHANNETGAIMDMHDMCSMIRKKLGDRVVIHCDATQTVGRLDRKHLTRALSESGCDLVTFSAHKFHGMKGCGCLYVSDRVRNSIDPLVFGGHQEGGLRPGTENIAGIVAMSMALGNVMHDRDAKNKKVLAMKLWILEKLQSRGVEFELIGPCARNTLPNTILIRFVEPTCDNAHLVQELSDRCVVVGIGAACHACGPSHVLAAMNLKPSEMIHVLRISLCDTTTWKGCKALVNALVEILRGTQDQKAN
jgi:cysteine desulfurase